MDRLSKSVSEIKQVWLADDATGAGRLAHLLRWWNTIISEGQKIGYNVNESKSWLILKDENELENAKHLFSNTAIKITTNGKRHLGAALGTKTFKDEYVKEKVEAWCKEITKLADFAKTQPHAAFSAYIHGQQHRFTYFLRTIEGMEDYLKPLDTTISNILLPAIFGTTISTQQRELYALPIKNGGLGFANLTEKASREYEASRVVNAPLVAIMMLQGNTLPNNEDRKSIISEQNRSKMAVLNRKIEQVENSLPTETLRIIEQTKQPGASNWLSVLPLEEHGFSLNKREFRDALSLRFNLTIKGIPSQCPCGQKFNITHAMNCKRGGFVIMRHNNIRDFEANLLSKICNDVEIEPPLQPITTERLPNSALKGDEARPDVRARGFWRKGQNAFFDVRVTNAGSESQRNVALKSVLIKHEREKKREYNERIMNIEHGTFTPLIFTIHGGMGPECAAYHQNIAEKIASKTGEQYAKILTFTRCKLSFIVLRSALLCLRGSRTIASRNLVAIDDNFVLNHDSAKL